MRFTLALLVALAADVRANVCACGRKDQMINGVSWSQICCNAAGGKFMDYTADWASTREAQNQCLLNGVGPDDPALGAFEGCCKMVGGLSSWNDWGVWKWGPGDDSKSGCTM